MTLFNLAGKVAVVTGGNGGIGLGIAEGLAEAGAKIAIVGRNAEKSAQAVDGLSRDSRREAIAVTADVTRPDDVDRVASEVVGRFGRIDILVNNAGIIIRKLPQEMTLEEWNAVMDANVTSAFLMSRALYLAAQAKRRGQGRQYRQHGVDLRLELRHLLRREQGGDRPAHQEPGAFLGAR